MEIGIELTGALVDYLPKEVEGKTKLTLADDATVEDILKHLQIKSRVAVAVNDEHDLDHDHPLADGDQILIFTGVSGG